MLDNEVISLAEEKATNRYNELRLYGGLRSIVKKQVLRMMP